MLLGSPPHAWGIRPPWWPRRRASSVHPHTRGEYALAKHQKISYGGSPPHAWGIRRQVAPLPLRRRFTPTRVGNTSRGPTEFCLPTVHPHTRGEYLSHVASDDMPVGSPPHAWGIRHLRLQAVQGNRFTPTRVGNTHPRPTRPPRQRGSPPHAWGIPTAVTFHSRARSVHPHTRGEYEIC